MNPGVEIRAELESISAIVATAAGSNPFAVPKGYFEALPDRILALAAVNEIENEEVPEGYFNLLPGLIMARIEGTAAHELRELSPLLAALPKDVPFEVPEKYFDATAQQLADTASEELTAMMSDARSLQAFEVPAGYFETLPEKILAQVKTPAAKVVSFGFRRVVRFAAAAVFTGLVALGIMKYSGHQMSNSNQPVAAALPGFIEEGKKMDTGKFDEKLDNLSEEEIVQYLSKNGSEADLAVLTSSIEADNLPDQDEYLINDKTLDNFIESMNTKN